MDRYMRELSNWERWGKEDQLGAVNLITPEKRRGAAKLVRKGISVSLARDIEKEKAIDNPHPFEHVMDWSGVSTPNQFSLDTFRVRYHGWAHTHLDSLCHMFYQGKMYNGFSQLEVTDQGARKLGVQVLKNGVFTRGILIDIPRLKGVPYLEPGHAIYPEDLEAWEKKAGVKVGSGDALFLRTGRWARRDVTGAWDVDKDAAGLHVSCTKWFKARDISFLGSDAASEVAPSGVEGLAAPVHQILLIAMGVPIFDNCDLEALGETAAELGQWEFLLTVAPLPVGGGTGSPLNPIATF
jgi:kynurenine formamidase